MVRVLADYDPSRIPALLRWPLREALLCYVERLKREATIEYRHQVLVWAMTAPHVKGKQKPPGIPAILKGPYSDGD